MVMLDIGCGYDAWMLQRSLPLISKGVAVDVALSEEVKSMPNIKACEQPAEDVLPGFATDYFDVILMNSVIEHLEDPLSVLKECRRVLKTGGLLISNVPTWCGKYFLEVSAFIFKLSNAAEVNDHKMYYNKKDLWPLLVKTGFRPGSIKLKYHKFGLNLFSTSYKD